MTDQAAESFPADSHITCILSKSIVLSGNILVKDSGVGTCVHFVIATQDDAMVDLSLVTKRMLMLLMAM